MIEQDEDQIKEINEIFDKYSAKMQALEEERLVVYKEFKVALEKASLEKVRNKLNKNYE